MNFATKYAPASLDDYYFVGADQESAVRAYLDGTNTRPLLLYGPPGTGKTALARLLPSAICADVQPGDTLFLNGSLDNGIDVVRVRMATFSRITKFNGLNRSFIIIDEADGFSGNAQDALKAELDAVQNHTQFIFTTNHPGRFSDALIDRCRLIELRALTADELMLPARRVMAQEGQQLDDEPLRELLEAGTGYDRTLSFREMYRRLERVVAAKQQSQNNHSK